MTAAQMADALKVKRGTYVSKGVLKEWRLTVHGIKAGKVQWTGGVGGDEGGVKETGVFSFAAMLHEGQWELETK